MDSRKFKTIFPLHTKLRRVLPLWFWTWMQILGVISAIGLVLLLLADPDTGLFVIWRWLVPVLPIVFLISPGAWRNVCPLATINQLPRKLGWKRSVRQPRPFARYSYLISVVLLLLLVVSRKILFNHDGMALAGLIGGLILLALLGGFLWTGKSGWCTSVCPVLPVELLYGQSPMLRVLNSHCQPCQRCTNNCFDRNPPITNLVEFHRSQRGFRGASRHFAAVFPGFVLAFYLLPDPPGMDVLSLCLGFSACMLGSYALYWLIKQTNFLREGALYALFGGVAINTYYWFNIPLIQDALSISPGGLFVWVLRGVVLSLTIVWLVRSHTKETQFVAAMNLTPQNDSLVTLKVVAAE